MLILSVPVKAEGSVKLPNIVYVDWIEMGGVRRVT